MAKINYKVVSMKDHHFRLDGTRFDSIVFSINDFDFGDETHDDDTVDLNFTRKIISDPDNILDSSEAAEEFSELLNDFVMQLLLDIIDDEKDNLISEVPAAMDTLKNAMHFDTDYAWGWHCNLAMSIMDSSGLDHKAANESAAHQMKMLFDVDVTKFRQYVAFGY